MLRTFLLCLGLAWLTPALAQTHVLSDNIDSIAVVIGNKEYRRTSTVDFAHNDAEAIKAYLIATLGFREQNVILVKDATLGEFTQLFGSEANPTGSQLWRSVTADRSNVFVYYSGHGVPDLATRQPFLLPHDGNPNIVESGYALQTLYRNLELVRQKIGAQRQLIVMIDACFTGETGRKGESLLAVSAPGFTPAKPRTGGGIVKLVATSGATPANWDANQKLGLFTSRFLMGAAGLARPAGAPETGPLAWTDLQRYLKDSVETAARRDSGREQAPEIDLASIALPVAQPVPAVARAVALARDEANWQRAKTAGERSALEAYVARCGETCLYREAAMALLLDKHRSAEAATDEQNWARLGSSGRYEDYLKGCGSVCAYRALAEGYLGQKTTGARPIEELYVALSFENQGQRQSKVISGKVTWRIDKDRPVPGRPIETVARADVALESAGLFFQVLIGLNTEPSTIDPAFPRSYAVNVRFSEGRKASAYRVDQLGIPEFGSLGDERGTPLAGTEIRKIDAVQFVAQLSNTPDVSEQNANLIRHSDLIILPVRFTSGRRGKIVIAVGDTGSTALREVLNLPPGYGNRGEP